MNEEHFSGKDDALEKAYRTAYLVAGFIRYTLTREEHDELDEWVGASDENLRLFEELTDETQIQRTLDWYKKLNTEKALNAVGERIQFVKPKPSRFRSLYYSIAIAATLVLIVGAYFLLRPSADKPAPNEIVETPTDIAPGSDKAMLTAAGRTIILDTAGQEVLKQIGITGGRGMIGYDVSPVIEVEYHTLTVPRKGKYHLVLSDGTKVWLNAASSIRYPTVFMEKERRVTITGEAYFEVKSLPLTPSGGGGIEKKPFIVSSNGVTTEVLGTHFNVNAYADEGDIKVTLLEGSVKVSGLPSPSGEGQGVRLKPGQQAKMKPNSPLGVGDIVDVDEVMAWKNNRFKFNDAEIESIMRQVQRWYDVEIEYKDTVAHHFNGTISRDEPLSGLLKLLEGTGRVHFKLEGNTLLVMK